MTGLRTPTIKLVIRKKINAWLATIKEPELVELLKRDTIVTGGCVTSMLMGERINDFDVYFKTFETAKAVATYYVQEFNTTKGTLSAKALAGVNPTIKEESVVNIKGETEQRIKIYMKSSGVAGEEQGVYSYFEHGQDSATAEFLTSTQDEGAEDPLFTAEQAYGAVAEDPLGTAEEVKTELKDPKKPPYRPVFMTDNAITLSDKMQLIIRFYGTPQEIHKNFDFIHCTGVYDYRADSLVVSEAMMRSLLSKSLVYSGSLYPIASLLRIRKFMKRGWRISAGQMLKIIFQLDGQPLTDPKFLKDQLMGVDVAYMHELIRAINNEPGRIDATYLATLVDQVFGDGG